MSSQSLLTNSGILWPTLIYKFFLMTAQLPGRAPFAKTASHPVVGAYENISVPLSRAFAMRVQMSKPNDESKEQIPSVRD